MDPGWGLPVAERDTAFGQIVLTQRTKALETPPTEPTQLASETLTRHLSPWVKGDALYNPTREEQLAGLKKVALDDVKKFHDQFYGANYGVFAVVGPVDQAAVQKAAAELLGNWNTSRSEEHTSELQS